MELLSCSHASASMHNVPHLGLGSDFPATALQVFHRCCLMSFESFHVFEAGICALGTVEVKPEKAAVRTPTMSLQYPLRDGRVDKNPFCVFFRFISVVASVNWNIACLLCRFQFLAPPGLISYQCKWMLGWHLTHGVDAEKGTCK